MNKDIMKQLGFEKEVESIEHGFCPFCHKPVSFDDFRDELSAKEYKVSGLCQVCQDKTFS